MLRMRKLNNEFALGKAYISQFLVVNALSRYLSKTRVTQRKGAIDSTLVEELEKADQGKDF